MTEPRGVGAVEFLQGALPGLALDALALLTWLGSVPLAIVLLTAFHWADGRERGAVGVAAGLGAVALTVGLKAAFALPRPPAPTRLIEASGFGFPSGHAIVATVLWGYLALAVERGTRGRRLAVAAVVVGVVALSRVALGVHHAVDVVAGVAVGAALLVGVSRLRDPTAAFGLAAALALGAAIATFGDGDALLVLGGAAAGLLLVARLSATGSPVGRDALLPAVAVAGVAGSLALAGYRFELGGPLEFAVGAAAVGGVVGLPWLAEHYRDAG